MGGMQPETSVNRPLRTKNFPKQRHFLAVFFISFTWGLFGVDRMYVGKWGTGILKLLTLGGGGIWLIIDLYLIMSGSFRDKYGRPMLEFAEYKKFASRTILIFAIVLGIVVLVTGVFIIAAVMYLFTGIQDGNLPGLDLLKGFTPGGLSPEQMTELGL